MNLPEAFVKSYFPEGLEWTGIYRLPLPPLAFDLDDLTASDAEPSTAGVATLTRAAEHLNTTHWTLFQFRTTEATREFLSAHAPPEIESLMEAIISRGCRSKNSPRSEIRIPS